MYPSFYAEVIILMLLTQVGWNGPPTTVLHCSRSKSRLVRMIIHKKILPVLLRYKISLPVSCPFHSRRDIFWWPDEHIDFKRESWSCPFCPYTFPSEEALVNHYDANHLKDFTQAEDSVCLATFCDIFRCDVIAANIESLGGKSLSHNLAKNFAFQGTGISCNQDHMFELQEKCKAVIRQCLLGLLATLSVKDFQDIQEELDLTLCSYLTCSRYWDGSLHEVHRVPVLLCIIVGLIMIGIFCISYYFVWLLIEAPDSAVDGKLYNGNVTCNPYYKTRPHVYSQYRPYTRVRSNRTHISRWLSTSGKRNYGNIPYINNFSDLECWRLWVFLY